MLTYPPLYGSLPIGAVASAENPTARRARIAVLSPADFDAATLVATSQQESLPIANVQNQRPKKVWRSLGIEEYVNVTHLVPVAPNLLVINAHRMSGQGVARVWLAPTIPETISAPAFDTGWQSVWPVGGKPALPSWPSFISAIPFPNTGNYLCARIGLADPGSPDGFIQVGRMSLGRYWQAEFQSYDFNGTPLAYVPKDIQTETDSGAIFTDRRARSAGRRFQLQITAETKASVIEGIDEITRLHGMWGDVFVFLDLNARGIEFQKSSMQGLFTAPAEHQIVPCFDDNGGEMMTVSFPLREVI